MAKWRKGVFTPKNPQKYIGNNADNITGRSSWEFTFMQFLDEHPSIQFWSSESVKLPYFNPLKNRQAIYIPDFYIVYRDKDGKAHQELIEIKPKSQSSLQEAKTRAQRLMVAVNHAKWAAAMNFCKHRDIVFRVLTEDEIYRGYAK